MAYKLLVVTMLFCGVVGAGLGSNDFTWWSLVGVTLAAAFALQFGYVATSLIHML